ncbi:phosphatidate cytidylyltransferase [Candidatus Korarchaeum cryptofilum]|jgi:dolichol kinase|uniref:Phosphatidate cytidylyltransferase n=1 Tax=Korarchaeum cryptofilum (strain OPF8) TaxID=374847 RepID=B1L628_KORCO|nr:phosphatidate cytidylyltransferase [Candidatus Korarchaeum cryptofilum]ACB07907.1 phosphatidate cytidylyltransferase [Candidatus Korarchaeum cryptofilum OPF8]
MIGETIRKLIHVIFSLLLAIPLFLKGYIEPGIVYGAALALGGIIYSTQVKGLPEWLKASMQIPQVRHLEAMVESFEKLISMVERDYERRSGWLGMMSGLIGGASSYFIFGHHMIYGVLALVFVDGISAIFGMNFGRRGVPFSNKTIEGTLSGFLSFYIILIPITGKLIESLILAAASSISELYGIEDNISVPIVASAVSYFLGLPVLIYP